MHGTFVASGPGIKRPATRRRDPRGRRRADARVPARHRRSAERPRQDPAEHHDGRARPAEITILDVSDYHGQLVAAHGDRRQRRGSRRGEPGLHDRRSRVPRARGSTSTAAEAVGGRRMTVAAGDSVGATPPISSFFGDTPTIELMNMMDFDADGLGNHNFDKGQAYLRNTLIPLADFPYLSANVVDSAAETPRSGTRRRSSASATSGSRWSGSPTRTPRPWSVPGAFDPFTVVPRRRQGPGRGQQARTSRSTPSWSWATTARPPGR